VRKKGLPAWRDTRSSAPKSSKQPQKHESPSSYAAGWSFAVPTTSRITMSPIFRPYYFFLQLLASVMTLNTIFTKFSSNYIKFKIDINVYLINIKFIWINRLLNYFILHLYTVTISRNFYKKDKYIYNNANLMSKPIGSFEYVLT